MFGMTEKDADNIAVGISHCHKLRHISLRNSKVVDSVLNVEKYKTYVFHIESFKFTDSR